MHGVGNCLPFFAANPKSLNLMNRQSKPKLRSRSRKARDSHASPVCLNNLLAEGQAQTQSV